MNRRERGRHPDELRRHSAHGGGQHRRLWIGIACAIGFVAILGRADAPPGRYTIANGTVYDTKTRLTWQQALDATMYTWSDAAQYCASLTLNGGGFRLPSMKELMTLIDEGRYQPAIDLSAFPGTPASGNATAFWTSSPVSNVASQAWFVSFGSGRVDPGATSDLLRARCVR